ncbi:hypothetical protein ACTXT7_005608 [Hymenolepis weldensis]
MQLLAGSCDVSHDVSFLEVNKRPPAHTPYSTVRPCVTKSIIRTLPFVGSFFSVTLYIDPAIPLPSIRAINRAFCRFIHAQRVLCKNLYMYKFSQVLPMVPKKVMQKEAEKVGDFVIRSGTNAFTYKLSNPKLISTTPANLKE